MNYIHKLECPSPFYCNCYPVNDSLVCLQCGKELDSTTILCKEHPGQGSIFKSNYKYKSDKTALQNLAEELGL